VPAVVAEGTVTEEYAGMVPVAVDMNVETLLVTQETAEELVLRQSS
jgi:hypothetical protein